MNDCTVKLPGIIVGFKKIQYSVKKFVGLKKK